MLYGAFLLGICIACLGKIWVLAGLVFDCQTIAPLSASEQWCRLPIKTELSLANMKYVRQGLIMSFLQQTL